MRIASRSFRVLSSLLCLAGPGLAHAGGLLFYEYATDNASLANAGAPEPSTFAGNPFRSATQANGGESREWLPGAGAFLGYRLSPALSAGFGLYGDSGVAANYDEAWGGRYFVQDARSTGFALAPGLAYRLGKQWSVGLGLRAVYGALDSGAAVDNDPQAVGDFADGQLHYKSDDWGYGANLGVIYQPRHGTRIGLSYTTEVDLEFEDRSRIANLRPPRAGLLDVRGILGAPQRLDLPTPQSATLSLYHAFDSRWAVLASAGWQDWSAFGRAGTERDADNPVAASGERKYRDTWHLAVGTQYQATPALRWQAGLAYDSAAGSERDRTFDTPMAKSWRLGAGVNYALDPGVELNLNYTFVWMGDMPITQSKGLNGRIATSGEFANAAIHVLSGSIPWRY